MKIDFWTLAIQAINVLILVFLLQHFFWRPVAGIITKRKAEAGALMDDAKGRKAEAEAALAEIEKSRAGFAAERQAILAAAKVEADKSASADLEAARHEAQALCAAAAAANARDDAAAETERLDLAAKLAVTIASRLVARLHGETVEAAFRGWLVSEIAAMPDTARKALAAGEMAEVQLVCAAPLSASGQAAASAEVCKAIGAPVKITFSVDPALIAGVELHSPYFSVRNSWQADLLRITGELAHGA
ncbi:MULTISPECIES: F0F1 ATP synthase subunit B family protein [unclassified Rhizobium]|uniref:F0F1 ATP synthase subunit B family protein n=1 Tax=unclassified Rhizobium TaxID=2613769 RepID=UPI001ADD28C9|nr:MULTISPECIES: ATPase [unclassified Rhizobium]MBO9099616.1 ATPase [Rhizobium sp. L58/93]QXZ86913.1 ATPase [Rhizobium sp. K1/93]QXZ93053.1 ATPase [Rhizobium sp. K15/93]